MPLILAAGNQKGGCGKTTTVINLAGGLTRAGQRVLVVDADPQASAAIWSLAKGQGSLPFDVLPARHLKKFSSLAQMDCDIVLVDCPPGASDWSTSASNNFAMDAIRGADAILVPLRPSTLDFSAAQTFVRFLAQHKDPSTKTAILLNGVRRTVTGREAPLVAAALFAPISGAIVLQTTIGLRESITEVCGSGKTIFDYAPSHVAAQEYAQLTKEIIQWLTNAHLSPLSVPSTTSTLSSQPAESAL